MRVSCVDPVVVSVVCRRVALCAAACAVLGLGGVSCGDDGSGAGTSNAENAAPVDAGVDASNGGGVDVGVDATPDAALDVADATTEPEDAQDDAPAEDAARDVAPDAVADAGEDTGDDGGGGKLCSFEDPGDPDKSRVVVVGQPFSNTAGEDNTSIRTMTLLPDGTLQDDGMMLDIGIQPRRVAFVPSGEFLIVLGERSKVLVLRVDGVDALEVVSEVELPTSGYSDLVLADGGRTVYAISQDVTEDHGIHTLRLDCDGTLEEDTGAFFGLRLTSSLALLPGESRGVLVGGQAVFDPVDDDDIRLLERDAQGAWSQLGAFDIFTDFIDTSRIDVSPDGRVALVPNGSGLSLEGQQVSVLSVEGDTISERARLVDLFDAREALFSPDGLTAIITLFEPGRVVVLADPGDGWQEVERIAGIGLPEQVAMVRRGGLEGLVLVPSTDSSAGPNIALLRFGGAGEVADLGQLDLGEGSVNIPTCVTVQP